MKRIIIILLGAIFAISANAQLVSTKSSEITIIKPQKPQKPPRIPPKLEFYVKVGANIMNADWNSMDWYGSYWSYRSPYKMVDGKSKFGVDFTFGFLSHFRPSRPSDFYWGAELSITQVGGGFDEFSYIEEYDVSGFHHTNTYNFHSSSVALWGASISPTIGWKKELSPNISLDLHLNPGILGNLGKKYIEYSYTEKILEETYNGNAREEIEGSSYVSLKGGIGLWFNKVSIDFSYRNLINIPGDMPNYSNVIISLGYKF